MPTGYSRVTPVRVHRSKNSDRQHIPAKQLSGPPEGPQKNLKKGSWHLHQWRPSGWNRLCLRALSENIPPQVAIDELWLAAGEGRIKATALECKNAKTFDGDRIEIPAHYWPHLKRVDDPLTGKAMLSDDNGRVYREVQFPRLDVKKLWPKSAGPPHTNSEVKQEAVPRNSIADVEARGKDKGGRPQEHDWDAVKSYAYDDTQTRSSRARQ